MDINKSIANVALESPNSATFLVDRNGFIISINKLYLRMLACKKEAVVGKHLLDVMPWEQTTIDVLKSRQGKDMYKWGFDKYKGAACSYPIIENGELEGCFTWTTLIDIFGARRLIDRLMAEHNADSRGAVPENGLKYRAKYTFDSIIGESSNMCEMKKIARQIAMNPDITVLIEGESGTGKELFAQAIHNQSPRANKPFVRINCAAIPPNLLESELFGYEEGAFTNAKKGGKIGKFELAGEGTIFLDEIGEMPLEMQSKLLVVLQERVLERIGSEKLTRLKCRVIAATNRDLQGMVANGQFRADLYYRLNVIKLTITPLRERMEDLSLLIAHIMKSLNIKNETDVQSIDDEAMEMMMKYKWPGNIRELNNVLERAILLTHIKKLSEIDGSTLMNTMAQELQMNSALESSSNHGLKEILEDVEKRIIIKTLDETENDINKAAQKMQVNKALLYRRVKKYNI